MGKGERIIRIISGLLIIFFAVLMLVFPEYAFLLASTMVAYLLLENGIRHLLYYLTMAHHMVGGKIILYYSVFMIDLGVFAVTISEKSKFIIIIYLIFAHLIAGGVGVIKAIRSKKEGYSWKLDLSKGLINVLIALTCVIFMSKMDVLIFVYFLSMLYLAAVYFVSAFRKSAVVYIQ